jgi:hypothetical protein
MRKTSSVQDILDRLHKQAADPFNSQTASQAKIDADDKPVVEGSRAAEMDASIKDSLGNWGTSHQPGAGNEKGDLNPPMQASTVAQPGEDPAQEKKETSLPAGVDAGTALQGAELGGSTIKDKTAAWKARAQAALMDCVKEASASAPAATETVADDFYSKIAGGDQDLASHVAGNVVELLASAEIFGREQARKVAAYIALEKAAEDDEEDDDDEGPSEGGGGSAPPSDAGAPPPMDAGPAPGGEGGGGSNPALEEIIAFLETLPPEELEALAAQLAGGGGGDPMAAGGDPMAGAPPAGDPMGGGAPMPPPDAMGLPPEAMKMAAAAKQAATKLSAGAVEHQVKEVLQDVFRRSSLKR